MLRPVEHVEYSLVDDHSEGEDTFNQLNIEVNMHAALYEPMSLLNIFDDVNESFAPLSIPYDLHGSPQGQYRCATAFITIESMLNPVIDCTMIGHHSIPNFTGFMSKP